MTLLVNNPDVVIVHIVVFAIAIATVHIVVVAIAIEVIRLLAVP